MRHDAKLGLALGMLVIGFAVAFCFPRQKVHAPVEAEPISLPPADSALALLPIRTYQSGLIGSPIPDVSAEVDDSSRPPTPLSPVTPVMIDGVPLTSVQVTAIVAPQPTPSSPVEVVPKSALPKKKAEDKELRPETYLVKAGDTLTGIATRLLGSSTRYGELFEANREILSSPNDLKIGMTLRVPPLIPPREPSEEDTSSIVEKAEQTLPVPSLPRTGIPRNFQRPPPAPWIAEELRARHPQ